MAAERAPVAIAWPEPSDNWVETAYWAFTSGMGANGLKTLRQDAERYESHFGPGSFGRDLAAISDAGRALITFNLSKYFGENGPTVSFEELSETFARDYINKDRPDIPVDEWPFWVDVARLVPPRPKNKDLDGLFHSIGRPIANEAWRKYLGEDASTPYTPPFIRLADTPTMQTTDEEYVIGDGLITKGGKLLLYAYAGAGKTTMLDHMAGALATGRAFLGVHAIDQPHKVLFVQGELTDSEIASHGQDLLEVFPDAGENVIFWRNTQLPLPEREAELRAAIVETGADVLFLDPFNRFFRGDNSVAPEQVGELFRMVDRLLEDPQLGLVAAVLSHHMNVSRARMAGTYDFEGWPSTILRLDKLTGSEERKLTYEKVRAPGSTYLGKVKNVILDSRGYHYSDEREAESPMAGPFLVSLALQDLGGEAFRQDLIERAMVRTNSRQRAVAGYVQQALQQGLIEKADIHGPAGKVIFRMGPNARQEPAD